MAKNKISEYSSTAANNTDVANINIAEGCSPSNINNAIRAVMSHLKNFQDGSSGDSLTNAGTLNVTGAFQLDGSAGTSGQVMLSAGSGTPTWGDAFVTGMIMMWSGTIATIPSGWYLCDGTNGTPDLTNKFIIGADADDGGVAKTSVTGTAAQSGGSKDAVVVEHNHNLSSNAVVSTKSLTGTIKSMVNIQNTAATGIFDFDQTGRCDVQGSLHYSGNTSIDASHNHTMSGNTDNEGVSGTNANLPPYFALAFIMKG